jgi:hypothetical protein
VLSLKDNKLGTKKAGKALGEMLKGNLVLKELDLSDNFVYPHDGGDAPGFAHGVASGLSDNGALSKLDASGNAMFGCRGDTTGVTAWAAALRASTSITELNLARNNINADDARALAPVIGNNEALTSLDISDNKLNRGAYKGSGHTANDSSYATDITGMCIFIGIAMKLFSDAILLQALSPLPMPSLIWGR